MASVRRKSRPHEERAADTGYELSDRAKQLLAKSPFGWCDPANREVYDPRPQSRVPESGAWALITRQLPPIEGRIDQHVRVGRVFYVEQLHGASGATDAAGFQPDGKYKVRCRSPWGEVHLLPYEYSMIDAAAILAMWADAELRFHPLDVEPARLSEVTFYARSRGIGPADAMVMALGTLAGPVGWFEPTSAELAEECEAMEHRAHSHVTLTARWPA